MEDLQGHSGKNGRSYILNGNIYFGDRNKKRLNGLLLITSAHTIVTENFPWKFPTSFPFCVYLTQM